MGLKKRNKVSAEFSMSSLTDIIFLLLIFFMLTSTLVSQNALNLKLPSSSSKTVAPQGIAVSIKPDGTYYYNGNRMPMRSIRSRIQQQAQNERNAETLTISIFADESVPLKFVTPILSIASDLRVNAILATQPD